MACQPCQARAAAAKNNQWRVLNENGVQVFTGTEKTARAVAKRYRGSKVEKVVPEPAKSK